MIKKQWFETWFDSSYYHILYNNRNEEEAKEFIQNLLKEIKLPAKAKVLDLACGKGRHAKTLHENGLIVTGADLAANSILEANKMSSENLNFIVHDMREPIKNEKFDAVFNLFTSFGYFDDLSDNDRVIESIHQMLNEQGILVIDFMNAIKVRQQLVTNETKIIDNIHFKIHKSVLKKHIYKIIKFTDEDHSFEFVEKVQMIELADFEKLLNQHNFEILNKFGNFKLEEFHETTSDRLIIIARKK